MRRLALILALAAAPAAAQQVVVSRAPDAVSVTIYRAPDRAPGGEISTWRPQGYALITETRTLTIPAGDAVIRFEGVAGNIFPESAIVDGLPSGVREKNLDADLLAPRTLYDRSLGRSVLIRRTDPGSGKVTETQGVIRSSAAGGMVVQTAAGVEAVHCSGLPETIIYPSVPEGLSTRPTLSVETIAPGPAKVTLTLSYLAGGFDWQADYVLHMRPDGRSADVTAWITLASSDVTSFTHAGTQVVAGKPNRSGNWYDFGPKGGGGMSYRCWPAGTPLLQAVPAPPPPPPPPPPPAPMMAGAMDIVVSASRARQATQEELGDLKLYRIQDRVTVASKAQKQVAMLTRAAVPVTPVYVSEIYEGYADGPVLTLRGKNRVDAGLGLPLPAGQVTVFEDGGTTQILAGEGAIDDKAVGEDVEFKLGARPEVNATLDVAAQNSRRRTADYALTVTNANPWPVAYEAKIGAYPGTKLTGSNAALADRDGRKVWAVTVPANGTLRLTYRARAPK